MNTIEKRIQAYLSKIPKHKVDLANLKNFQARNKTFEKSLQDFTSDITNIVRIREAARQKYVTIVNNFSNLDKEYQEFRKAVIDLGVKMPSNIESDYKIATGLMKSINNDYRELIR